MRLHRFYISEIVGDKKEITINSVEQTNQICRVFRLKSGDSVIVFDGSGCDYECRIEKFKKGSILLAVISTSKSRYMPVRDIYLCVGVVKKDTFEWIVEKATELGVTHIIPVMAERSEKKSLNMERLEKIVVEASEQSGRGNVPIINNIMTLDESLEFFKEKGNIKLVAFHTEDSDVSLAVSLGRDTVFRGGEAERGRTVPARSDTVSPKDKSPIAIFIGPEGGWSPNEISLFHKNGVQLECLGHQVLRTETAVVSAISLIVFGK
ncbi:MAG: RsmE family RNA methyltransferase [Patescibacteria group bacterium]